MTVDPVAVARLLFTPPNVYSADGTGRVSSSHTDTVDNRSSDDLAQVARSVADRVVGEELLGNGAADLAIPKGSS